MGPVIEFHGDKDMTIPIAHAYAAKAEYSKTGVPYELHILNGCGHGAWCYNGKGTAPLAVRMAKPTSMDMIQQWTQLRFPSLQSSSILHFSTELTRAAETGTPSWIIINWKDRRAQK